VDQNLLNLYVQQGRGSDRPVERMGWRG